MYSFKLTYAVFELVYISSILTTTYRWTIAVVWLTRLSGHRHYDTKYYDQQSDFRVHRGPPSLVPVVYRFPFQWVL
jgi:hypothetical protein